MGNTPLDSTVISKGIVKAVLILFGISLLGYFLYSIRQIIAYIVVASIIALLGNPLMRRLKKIKYIPNALAAVLSLGILSFLFFGLSFSPAGFWLRDGRDALARRRDYPETNREITKSLSLLK